MGLYALDENYSLATYYENSGAYDLWTGTDLLLDQTRHILASDNYVFQGVAFPKGKDIQFKFQSSFTGSINLIPYSYIVGLMGYNEVSNFGGPGLYTLRIYDKGAQSDLYYGQFAWYPTVIGTGQNQFSEVGKFLPVGFPNVPFGAYLFRDPLIVLPPGVLQIQISNVSQNSAFFGSTGILNAQLLFMIAVPKDTVTMQSRRIVTPSDPTGLQTLIGDAASLLG